VNKGRRKDANTAIVTVKNSGRTNQTLYAIGAKGSDKVFPLMFVTCFPLDFSSSSVCSLGFRVHFLPSFYHSPSCLWLSPLSFSFRCPMDCCFWNSLHFHSKRMAYPAPSPSSNDSLLVFSWWYWANRSLLEITLGQKIRSIFLRVFVWNDDSFFLSCFVIRQHLDPHRCTGKT